ncbi:MAG: hypothetical protein U0183_03200 [Polyangiaceae bacterium]
MKLWRLALPVLSASIATMACSSDPVGTGTGGTSTYPPSDPGKGGILVTVSGEDLAIKGYDFTPASLAEGDPPAFVDGWELRFEHVIVTLDNVRLSADPDKDPGSPDVVGETVAEAKGPFAVDVTIGGPITGKSGEPEEKTVAIAAFKDTRTGAFDPQSRYAFGYDIVAANDKATLVNLDETGKTLYRDAVAKGYATVLVGTATYKGPAPEAGTVFAKIPKKVKFTLGLKNPASYLNCQNTDLTAKGDEFPRGIQVSPEKTTTAQITIHTDHLFWDKLNVEGTPLHFDPIAARASTYGTPDSEGTVNIDDLASVDVTAFTTKAGEPLPGRSVVADYKAPAGQLRFDTNGVTFTKANSFAAFLGYTATSGGHLNSDGECEVKLGYTP